MTQSCPKKPEKGDTILKERGRNLRLRLKVVYKENPDAEVYLNVNLKSTTYKLLGLDPNGSILTAPAENLTTNYTTDIVLSAFWDHIWVKKATPLLPESPEETLEL